MALEIEGSNPSTHPTEFAPIAQRTEHRSSEPRVVGSNPSRRALESPSFADWLDAKTFLLGCPKRLIEVAHKIRYGFTRYFGHLKRLG